MRIVEDGSSQPILPGCAAATVAVLLCFAVSGVRAEDRDGGVLRWMAQGNQIYRCSQDNGRNQWVLARPQAVLKDKDGVVKAEHGAGPTWRAGDGSEVQGVVVTTIPAPKLGAISWLVLRVSRHIGRGLLDHVAYVLRTDTDGGIAPEAGCDSSQPSREVSVPYHAIYTFIAGSNFTTAD